MSVVYSAAVKTARMTAVRDAIDAGLAAGALEVCSAAYAAVLATVALAYPSGTIAADVLTFTMPQSDVSADADGVPAVARIKDSAGNICVSGLTVGLTGSGADIIVDSMSITAGQTVTVQSGTITHAA